MAAHSPALGAALPGATYTSVSGWSSKAPLLSPPAFVLTLQAVSEPLTAPARRSK
ncbi:hypothetical protein [Streptomyces sp. NPDC001250]|uniref:hypothetical protein n=1 Tax=unclassified Streptomyces TaxID=2593676 RepID=UPI003321D08E